jgi:hypothetical protein
VIAVATNVLFLELSGRQYLRGAVLTIVLNEHLRRPLVRRGPGSERE